MSRGNLKARRLVSGQVVNSRLLGPSPGIGLHKPKPENPHMQNQITTSRRAVLAGAAALATGATVNTAAIAALSATESDPIFAAIETHKAAFRLWQEKSRIRSNMVDAKWAPEYDAELVDAAQTASHDAHGAASAAANALTTIHPTTMAGILALIEYVEAFNAGAYFLEPLQPGDTLDDWRSAPMFWPAHVADEIDLFGYLVLANVRRALEAMVQA